jgi:acyl carrier protein
MSSRTPETVLNEVQPIFQEILDEPGLVVTRDSSASNTSGWDSLAHIDIIEAVERHFQVRFTLTELQDLKSVGNVVDLVIQKQSTS